MCVQFILLMVLLVMRKRISLVVTLFQEAGQCVASIPMVMVQPLFTFLLLILFFVYWVIILAYLSTAGESEKTFWSVLGTRFGLGFEDVFEGDLITVWWVGVVYCVV